MKPEPSRICRVKVRCYQRIPESSTSSSDDQILLSLAGLTTVGEVLQAVRERVEHPLASSLHVLHLTSEGREWPGRAMKEGEPVSQTLSHNDLLLATPAYDPAS